MRYANPPSKCRACGKDTLVKQETYTEAIPNTFHNRTLGFGMTCLNKQCSTSGTVVRYNLGEF